MATQENTLIARRLAGIFGGKPQVQQFFDDGKQISVDLLSCPDTPDDEISSYATLGLSDFDIVDSTGSNLPFRIELVAVCEMSADTFPKALSTCAFSIIKDKFPIYPGCVIPNIFDYYDDLSATLSHGFLVSPFIWNEELATMSFETKEVAFLQMIPIADAEYEYWKSHGGDELELLFENEQPDIFDINREPVL